MGRKGCLWTVEGNQRTLPALLVGGTVRPCSHVFRARFLWVCSAGLILPGCAAPCPADWCPEPAWQAALQWQHGGSPEPYMSSHQSSLTQNHCSTLEKHKTQTLQSLFASAEDVAAHKKTKKTTYSPFIYIFSCCHLFLIRIMWVLGQLQQPLGTLPYQWKTSINNILEDFFFVVT